MAKSDVGVQNFPYTLLSLVPVKLGVPPLGVWGYSENDQEAIGKKEFQIRFQ